MSYSSRQVCERSGATYRQLDYWDRVGWLSPSIREAGGSGAGKARLYNEQDVEIARTLLQLMRLRERGGDQPDIAAILTCTLRKGQRSFVINPDGQVTKWATGPVCLTVDLDWDSGDDLIGR